MGRKVLNLKTMFTITDKITHNSLHQIKCYKQGLFWEAYEQSAYCIWEQKGYKPTKKWFKNSNQDVVQGGFLNLEELLRSKKQNHDLSHFQPKT